MSDAITIKITKLMKDDEITFKFIRTNINIITIAKTDRITINFFNQPPFPFLKLFLFKFFKS